MRSTRQAWLVARKDAIGLVRDGRLQVTAALVVVLTVAAVAGGVADRARADRERADAREAERDRWIDQGDVNPHAAAHYGTFVFRPVEPLAALDPGLLPFVGAVVFLEAHQQQVARHRPVDDTTPLRRFRALSVASCLQWLVPLLTVLLAHASVAGERERGTWRLLLSVGAKPVALALGKAAGVGGPLLVVLAVPGVAGAALLWNVDGIDVETARRAAWMGLAYAAYTTIWLSAGLFVSAVARSTRQALTVLLLVWLLVCMVMPPLGLALATRWHPTPSSTAFQAAIDAARAARPDWDTRVDLATERFLNGEDLPPASNPEVVALIEAEADDTAIFEARFAALSSVFAQQTDVYQWVGLFSPMLAIQSFSMAMAATDDAHTRHFQEAAARYRSVLLDVLNNELAAVDSWKTFSAAGGRDLWARVPEFDYDTPPAAWAVAHQRRSLAALGGWLLVAVTAAAMALTKAARA